MRLATLRIDGSTRAAVKVNDDFALLDASDVAALLRSPDWETLVEQASLRGSLVPAASADFAPLVTSAGKIICCGLNYRDHIQETGRETPEFPTLFGKFNDTLTGAYDEIHLPPESEKVDWEAELVVVVGTRLQNATPVEAVQAIAGYSIANDISMRDWQQRTVQWLQGKVFTATTPVGPEMVTADEFSPLLPHGISTEVNGKVAQNSKTDQLIFTCADLLAYISKFTVLSPGDIVLTGTPGGVGMAATPPQYLQNGDVLVTSIDGIGFQRNLFTNAV